MTEDEKLVWETWTADDRALEMLHSAVVYIRAQWDINFSRELAKSNLDARAILWNCSNAILKEYGAGVSREEVEGAIIIERAFNGGTQ